MSTEKKLTEEQLTKLQSFVNAINQAQTELGGMEVRKHQLLHQVSTAQEDFGAFQKELEDEYGKVSISIEDGSIKLIEEDAAQEVSLEGDDAN